ncbi:hypothetical protein B5E87_01215 [Massilimicrobiota sp. An142]|uniref:hypothetical protein n=1 Tax=Massilimicrobiota sp. An142 TaxID=1965564 RepID=UPI000B382D9F|nr:hypothetical protein [Massilimicrobiota sp. An142]OUQ14739.1 hypothetical protein B5E87_01215 [Massilimicrobiota sp. An142]
MEYKDYMNQIQQRLNTMSEEEKNQWIYQYARVLDKSQRQKMLESLNFEHSQIINFHEKDFQQFIKDVSDGELTIPATEEDDYYYGYDSEYITYYTKECDLLNQLNDYIQDAFLYINNCQYQQGFNILQKLQDLEYEAVYDYGDIYELSFAELFENNLMDVSLEQYSLYYLYAAFQLHRNISEMYSYFNQSKVEYVLSDLMAFGPEEITLSDDEYDRWISFLENTPGDYAAKLLRDICFLYGDINQLTKMTFEIGAKHPSLYLDVIDYDLSLHQLEHAKTIASQAFKQLDEGLTIRSKIAEKLIPYFQDDIELYKISFLFNPQINHCLQLYTLDCDIAFIKTEFQKKNYAIRFEFATLEQEKASLSSDQKEILLFFLGDYENILEKAEKDQNNLGWSSNLKGILIPLLLMYLKPEKMHFVADDAVMDDLRRSLKVSGEDFYQLFHIWKEKYMITDEFKKKCIQWLKDEIEQRAEVIVGGTHRHSYYEVAKEIVVLSEILYLNKNITSMETFVKDYIKRYSRKHAFKAEMLKYAKQA